MTAGSIEHVNVILNGMPERHTAYTSIMLAIPDNLVNRIMFNNSNHTTGRVKPLSIQTEWAKYMHMGQGAY